MLDPSALSSISLVLSTWGSAFLVALWASLIFWTWRDINSRSEDRLLKILALLVVAVLFLPGVLIYFILRPQQTLDEEYQRTLEEEALLRTIEDAQQCPGCSRLIEKTWTVCPDCHTRLKKTCHACGRLMELHWNLCAHCGAPAPGMRKENTTMDEALRPAPGFSDDK
jgi:RNA polymerase subunit RPABC4/transcription elongation factor Spt4